jgi:hypothetical protein
MDERLRFVARRKPIKQAELLNAILTAMGAVPTEAEATFPRTGKTASTAREGLRVLVVEDNEFNQELVARRLDIFHRKLPAAHFHAER